jgi:PAS domain-containing protein
VLGCQLDLTERNRAEEDRARLAAIVQSSEDAIVGKTLSGIVTSWNEGARRLFGYTAEEMLANPLRSFLRSYRRRADILAERGECVEHLKRCAGTKTAAWSTSPEHSPIRDPAAELLALPRSPAMWECETCPGGCGPSQ